MPFAVNKRFLFYSFNIELFITSLYKCRIKLINWRNFVV